MRRGRVILQYEEEGTEIHTAVDGVGHVDRSGWLVFIADDSPTECWYPPHTVLTWEVHHDEAS